MAYSKRLSEVLGEPEGVLAGVSGSKAAMRIARNGDEISPATVINVKSGQYGRDGKSVSIIARAYAKELLERFGDEIEQVAGGRTPDAAEQWLLWVANPRLSDVGVAEAPAEPDAVALMDSEMERLEREYGLPFSYDKHGGSKKLTVEKVKAIIDTFESELKRRKT